MLSILVLELIVVKMHKIVKFGNLARSPAAPLGLAAEGKTQEIGNAISKNHCAPSKSDLHFPPLFLN